MGRRSKCFQSLFKASLLISVVLFLSGCASTAIYSEYDSDTKKWSPKYKFVTKGKAKTIFKKDGIDIEQDNKNEPIIKIELPLNKIGG